MILGADKTRLSKRHGATSVMAYREQGYLPEAMVNYLVRLGWSHGDQEIFSMDELVEKFSLESVGRSAGVFNPEKLLWLNQHYLKSGDPARIGQLLLEFLEKNGLNPTGGPDPAKVVRTLRERSKTLVEMAADGDFYYLSDPDYDPEATAKWLTAERKPLLEGLTRQLGGCGDWSEEGLEKEFTRFLQEHDLKLGKIGPAVRVALTGRTQAPGLFEVMNTLDAKRTISRLEKAVKLCK